MKPKTIPLQLLTHLYGASDEYWRVRANDGRLGPITTEPGRVRNRLCDVAEIERRYGERSEDQFLGAVAAYEAIHCITRRVS